MKKIIFILFAAIFISGCSTINNPQANYHKQLTIGMSKYQVEQIMGPPEHYLSAQRTPYGYEEVLQYRNIYNEIFALEFVDDYLVSADHIYSGAWYPMYPSAVRPPYGRPVFPPNYRPNRPTPIPPASTRPPANSNNRPSASPRPPANTQPAATPRPSVNNNTSNSSRNNTRENIQQPNTRQDSRERERSNSSSPDQSTRTTRSR